MSDRPKVGPADPETLRKAIARAREEAIAEAKLGLYRTPPTVPTIKKPALAAGVMAVGNRKRQIEDAVDSATDDPAYKRKMRAEALRR